MNVVKAYLIWILNVCFSMLLHAQTEADTIKYNEVLWSAEKRNVISETMNLSMVEASVFWPIYESYERTRRSLTSNYVLTINSFIREYPYLTEQKSHYFAKQLFLYERELLRLHRIYYVRLKNAIGGTKANKFIQLEVHIQSAVTYGSQTRLPFINDMETKALSSGKD